MKTFLIIFFGFISLAFTSGSKLLVCVNVDSFFCHAKDSAVVKINDIIVYRNYSNRVDTGILCNQKLIKLKKKYKVEFYLNNELKDYYEIYNSKIIASVHIKLSFYNGRLLWTSSPQQ